MPRTVISDREILPGRRVPHVFGAVPDGFARCLMDALVSVDMARRITDSNEAYQKMVGYTPLELGAMTYIDLTPGKWHAFEASKDWGKASCRFHPKAMGRS